MAEEWRKNDDQPPAARTFETTTPRANASEMEEAEDKVVADVQADTTPKEGNP